MTASDAHFGILLSAILAMGGYIWRVSQSRVTKLAECLDDVEKGLNKTVQTLAVITERLAGHLEWSAENFTPDGRQRKRRDDEGNT